MISNMADLMQTEVLRVLTADQVRLFVAESAEPAQPEWVQRIAALAHEEIADRYAPDQARDDHGRFAKEDAVNLQGTASPEDIAAQREQNYPHDPGGLKFMATTPGGVNTGMGKGAHPDDRMRGTVKNEIAGNVGKRMFADVGAKVLASSPYVSYIYGEAVGSKELEAAITKDQGYAAANKMVRQWGDSSGDSNEASIEIQRAAAEEFGLDPEEILRWTGSYRGYYGDSEPSSRLWENPDYETDGPAMRAFVRAQYENTQEHFARNGVDSIFLWRGVSDLAVNGEAGVETMNSRPDEDEEAQVRLNPLSSWTTEHDTCDSFGSIPLGMRIPTSRIISSAVTGAGCLNEFEYIVMGPRKGDPTDHIVIEHASRRRSNW